MGLYASATALFLLRLNLKAVFSELDIPASAVFATLGLGFHVLSIQNPVGDLVLRCKRWTPPPKSGKATLYPTFCSALWNPFGRERESIGLKNMERCLGHCPLQ